MRPHILLVMLISRRCNLKCTYCNVDAGPDVLEPRLSLQQVHAWVEAFASLGQMNLSVQLHGGEPLLVRPSVELYAAVVRNAVSKFAGVQLIDIAIQSNGLLLDRNRVARLARAHVRVNISVDGPSTVHDRHRITAAGKASHEMAYKAVKTLRAAGAHDEVISVVTEPNDVVSSVRYFMAEGFGGAKMNPVRPEGRGVIFGSAQERAFMSAMATEYVRAAKEISAHNLATEGSRFFEGNISALAKAAVRSADEEVTAGVGWTFLIDDSGTLWAHPSAYGMHRLRVAGTDDDLAAALRRFFHLKGDSKATSDLTSLMLGRQDALFSVCATCPTPTHCKAYAGRTLENSATTEHLCVWRRQLVAEFRDWHQRCPQEVDALIQHPVDRHPVKTVDVLGSMPEDERLGEENVKGGTDEAVRPKVRAFLSKVRIQSDGNHYIEQYPDVIEEALTLDPEAERQTFIQLAVIARQLKQAKATHLAASVAALAHIGLDPMDAPSIN